MTATTAVFGGSRGRAAVAGVGTGTTGNGDNSLAASSSLFAVDANRCRGAPEVRFTSVSRATLGSAPMPEFVVSAVDELRSMWRVAVPTGRLLATRSVSARVSMC